MNAVQCSGWCTCTVSSFIFACGLSYAHTPLAIAHPSFWYGAKVKQDEGVVELLSARNKLKSVALLFCLCNLHGMLIDRLNIAIIRVMTVCLTGPRSKQLTRDWDKQVPLAAHTTQRSFPGSTLLRLCLCVCKFTAECMCACSQLCGAPACLDGQRLIGPAIVSSLTFQRSQT